MTAAAIDRRPIWLLVAAGVAFGVYLRVQQLGFPPRLTFDEHHFVENARNYLAGRPDWNDHPPLGKLLMALCMRALGDGPVGWRAAALMFGLGSLALAFFAARVLFRDPLAGGLAALLLALDGFPLVYSRTALLDGMLLGFGFCVLLLLAPGPRSWRIIAAGAVAGLASSIKISGVTLALPIALALLALRARPARKLLLACASGLSLLLAFYAQYALGQRLTGLPASPAGVARATLVLIKHHAGLTQMTNPLTSHWYSWFLPWRPITLRFDPAPGGYVRAMTTLDNPLLWWSSALLVLATLACLLWHGVRALRARGPGAPGLASLLEREWPALLPCACWLGFLSPWVLTARDSYIYHYLPSYGFGLVLLAGAAARAFPRHPRAVLLALLVAAEVSVFYAPVWAQLPLSLSAYKLRLFLPIWR